MPITVQAALLGVVQGVTEFLPVSSSAHLILARMFFGFDGDKLGLAFDVACHVGTLVAVLIYFRAEIGGMLSAVPDLFKPARGGAASHASDPARENARLVWLPRVRTDPALILGLL